MYIQYSEYSIKGTYFGPLSFTIMRFHYTFRKRFFGLMTDINHSEFLSHQIRLAEILGYLSRLINKLQTNRLFEEAIVACLEQVPLTSKQTTYVWAEAGLLVTLQILYLRLI